MWKRCSGGAATCRASRTATRPAASSPSGRRSTHRCRVRRPDVIKRAMIQWGALEVQPAALLLQVHDELLFEAPKGEAESALPVIRRIMEGAASFSVPLTVEIGMGANWGSAH